MLYHCTEQHFRVFDKVLIDGNAVIVNAYIDPTVLCLFNDFISFLKEQNVCRYFRSCARLKRIVRQTNCAQQLCTVSDILSYIAVLFVQCSFGRNSRNNSARSNLI